MLYVHEFGRPSRVSPRARDELLLRSAGGDQAAFGAFFDELAPTLVALVSHIVDDLEQVYDVVHEIFVLLWRQSGDYNPAQQSSTLWAVSKALRACKPVRKRVEHAAIAVPARLPAEAVDRSPSRVLTSTKEPPSWGET